MLEFMKKKILIPGLIIVALGLFFSFKLANQHTSNPDLEEEKKTILQTAIALINQGHFSPKEIDDDFSMAAFEETIKNLDFDKKFFLKSDYDRLKKTYGKTIDDEIRNNELKFFYDINDVFVTRVSEAKEIYPQILAEPFDFDVEEYVELDGKKLEFAKDKEELVDRWSKNMKHRVIIKFQDLREAEKEKLADSADYIVKSDAVLEEEAREAILKIQDRYFKRLERLNENDRFSLFINSLTSIEDPHTGYMPPEDKKRFEEMMSGTFIGIGASLLQGDDGKIKVGGIIVGSPSWKEGSLKEDDEILRVAQGDDTPVDVEGMDLSDVVKIIRGKDGTEVRLHVRHADGTNEVISIIRSKVEMEDIFAKSAIIELDQKNMGYIYLPEFYSNFNALGSRRSGRDVEIEVKKLKAENVDGIILDLRNNGGGSLSDVIEMAGIFLGKTPVVQVLSSGGQKVTLQSKATNPVYEGPLIIMVNGSSASASEILAAVLQDHKRATIVGSKTFGKGTVQKLIPLDQFVPSSVRNKIINAFNKAKDGETEYDGIGSLKLTIQKFYRVNGGSTQLEGVTPDIIFPSSYDSLDFGERRNENALPYDKIPSVPYKTWKTAMPLEKLRANSMNRIKSNEVFDLVKATSIRLKKQQDDNLMPLRLKDYKLYQKDMEILKERMKAIDSVGTPLIAKNIKADLERIEVDSSSVEKNKKWLEAIQKDAYIFETSNIMKDWLSFNKKKSSD